MNRLNPDTENNPEIKFTSWNKIYHKILKLADSIKKSGFEPDVIVGVSRGGWIPARILSDLLGNPELASVTAEFYVGIGETEGEPRITQTVSFPVKNRKVLVVDEVADTGKSLKLVNAHLKKRGATEVRNAVIYCKPWSITVPDYSVKETRRWIVFPWEQKEAVERIVEKFRPEKETLEQIEEKLISSGLDRKLAERFIKETFRRKR